METVAFSGASGRTHSPVVGWAAGHGHCDTPRSDDGVCIRTHKPCEEPQCHCRVSSRSFLLLPQIWVENSDGSGAVNFLTGMGGFLQAVLFGYTGFR